MDNEELTQALIEISDIQKEIETHYKDECEDYWASLSEKEKLKVFYSVISRVVQGELKNKGSYRHVLYEVFGFGPEAYVIGMECGFLDLHNSIFTSEELKELKKHVYNAP